MVITDRFVYIHLPKTGGSFVVSALRRLHGEEHIHFGTWNMLKRVLYLPVAFKTPAGTLTFAAYKHSGCKRIPAAHRRKAILSNMRHPLDYYVSQYEFGWWKQKMYLPRYYLRVPGFHRRFPRFPDLSFPEFLELWTSALNHRSHTNFSDPNEVGYYTNIFVDCFFKDPQEVLASWSTDYVRSEAYLHDLLPVEFIHTHDLNRQLRNYLERQGYSAEQTNFILEKDPVLPGGKGRSKDQHWQKYYTEELKALILSKDRLLFDLFPQYRETVSIK